MTAMAGPPVINDVIHAELSVGFPAIEPLDLLLGEMVIRLEPVPRPALVLAAKAFQQYRARGGTRTGVLPDFFIGAHAAVTGMVLLTRDVRRMRGYFPQVRAVGPQG
jgi:predicted nucleic acid-binding protein